MSLNNLNVENRYCRFVNCHCFTYRKLVVRYLSPHSTVPKSKPSTSCHLKAIVPEFGGIPFSIRTEKLLFYEMCKTEAAAYR